MPAIKGVIRNGQVILPEPANYPDGTEVTVQLPDPSNILDDEAPMTPEEISRVLAVLDRMQPVEMTDEVRSALQADREARKKWEKDRFNEHGDKFGNMWK